MFDALNTPDWAKRSDLPCLNGNPEDWFPDREAIENRHAPALCAGCPALLECGTWALEQNEEWGIWGGMSSQDRRRILRNGSTTPKIRPTPTYDPTVAIRPSCGTARGYRSHQRHKETACAPCCDAEAVRSFERREKAKKETAA